MSVTPLESRAAIRSALSFLAAGAIWTAALHFILAGVFENAAEAARWQASSALLPIAVAAGMVYRLARRPLGVRHDPSALVTELSRADAYGQGAHWVPVAIFLALSLLIGAFGFSFYRHSLGAHQLSQTQQLTAIAEFKRRQIEDWLEERKRDSMTWSQGSLFGDAVAQWLAGDGDAPELRRKIEKRLWHIKDTFGYASVALLDREGRAKLIAGADRPSFPGTAEMARAALATGETQFSDLYRGDDRDHAQIRLEFLAPIRAMNDPQPIGALVFSTDPDKFLFPLIQSWPLPNLTAETLLVRKEGSRVLYLNELRHRRNTALNLSFPLDEEQLAAAAAARGVTGAIQGKDYRGVPILGYIADIAGTPWHIVAKIDIDEVNAPVRREALTVTGVALFFMLASGGALGLWWRQRRLAMATAFYQGRAERNALAANLDYLARYANDIILLTAPGEKIVECNDRALAAYGYPQNELIGLTLRELVPAELGEAAVRAFSAVYRDGSVRFESSHRGKDGKVFPVEVSARLIDLGETAYVQSIIRDIGESKRAEAEIARLSALREILSRGNRAIARAEHRDILLHEICRIAVRHGGFETACVYGAAADGALPEALACFGNPRSAGSARDAPNVRDGADEALRAGREGPIVIGDARAEAFSLPRLSDTPLRGFGAYAAIPFSDGLEFTGALLLFSARPDHDFQGEYQQFLADLAADLSFGLRFLRQRDELKTYKERLGSILDSVDAIIWSMDAHTYQLLYINPSVVRLTGYTDETLMAHPNLWPEMIVPEDRERVAGELDKIGATGLFHCDYRIIRPDGALRWISDQGIAVYDPAHRPTRVDGVGTDITERRINEIVSEAINLISGAFLFRRDTAELFGRIAGFLSENLRFPIAAIGLHNPAAERTECLGLAEIADLALAHPLPGLAEVVGAVAASGETWYEWDIAQTADPRLNGLGELGGRSFLCLPVRIGETVLGALLLADRIYRPDVDTLSAPMRMVAHHLALELDRRRTAGILDHHARSLRALIDSLHIFVGITTPEGVVTDVNRAALMAGELDARDVIGKPFEETYWWSYSPAVQDRIRSAVAQAAQGMEIRFTDSVRVAEGRFITVDVAIAPVRGPDGRVTHLIPSGVDMTQRTETEEALRRELGRLELCFNACPDGLALLDPDSGRCLKANAALSALLGYARDEIPGLTLAQITGIEAAEPESREWARLLKGEIESFSLRRLCPRKDGGPLETELRMVCRRTEHGEVDAVLASFTTDGRERYPARRNPELPELFR